MAKIAFVQEESYEKLSIMILSAVLKEQGHQTDIFVSKLETNLCDAITNFKPDFIAFSIYFGEEAFTLCLLKKIKILIPTATTLLGGPLFFISQKLLEEDTVDVVISGDGEKNLPIVVDKLSSSKSLTEIPGVSYKKNGKIIRSERFMVTENLEDLPMHDRDIYPSKYKSIRNQSTKYFIRSRGCPYKCKFCGNSFITQKYKSEGKGFRIYKKYQKLFEEIQYTKEKYGLKWVQFVDGTFNASKEVTKEFLNEYANANMPPFICNIRSEGIDNEMVDLLKQAGCDRVTIGLQSAIPRIQKIAGRTARNQIVQDAVKLFKKFKIRIGIDMIIGWPGETIDDLWESINFVRELNPDYVSTNLLVLFPETEIAKYAFENNFISKMPGIDDFAGYVTLENDSPAGMNVTNQIKNTERLFEFAVYHNRLEMFIKLLTKTNWNKLINMIHHFPSLKRSFQYDNIAFNAKLKRIYWFIKL